MTKQEFPKWLYHVSGAAKIVTSAEEMAAHGSEWAETIFEKAVDAVITAPIEAVENTLADAFEAVANEAETVAKRVRKPKKTAGTPAN